MFEIFKKNKNLVIFSIIFLIFVLFLLISKLIYPFFAILIPSSYMQFNRVPLSLLQILITILFYLSISLLFTYFFIKKEMENKKYIILLLFLNFFVFILGSFSQNTIYHNDEYVWLSFIKNYQIDQQISFSSSYILNFFPHMLAFLCNITGISANNMLLYFSPILFFLMRAPLFVKFLNSFNNSKKIKLYGLLMIFYPYWPRSLTPYSFITSIFLLIVYMFPFKTKRRKIFSFILSIVAFLSHIHGIFIILFFFFLFIIDFLRTDKSKNIFLFIIIFCVNFPIILFKIFADNEVIVSLISEGTIFSKLLYQIVVRILWKYTGLDVILNETNYFLFRGITFSSVYYSLLYFSIFFMAFCVFLKYREKIPKKIDQNYCRLFFLIFSIFICSMFIGYNTLFYRVFRFLIFFGIWSIDSLFSLNFFKKLKDKYKSFELPLTKVYGLVLFVIIFISQLSCYILYVPPSQNELDGIYYIQNNLLDKEPVILIPISTGKVLYWITKYDNISVYNIWERDLEKNYPLNKIIPYLTWDSFWIQFGEKNLTDLSIVFKNYSVNIVVWTFQSAMVENINSTQKLEYFSSNNLLFQLYNDNYF